MRAHALPLVLICGLLAACSNSAPSLTATSLPVTPSPVVSAVSTLNAPDNSAPDNSAPDNSTTENTPQATLDGNPQPTVESTPRATIQVVSTPSRAVASTVASIVTPVPIPGGPLTIVALGDSLTEGDGDQPGDGGGYPARLQKSIDEVRPNSRVINLGKSGWTSEQMVNDQLPSALEARPQIALVWIGSNDLWQNNGAEQEAAELGKYRNNIDRTLRALTGAGARVFIALLDDQSKRPYATNPAGASLSPEGVAYMSHLGDAFNSAIKARAAEYGATAIDFYNTTIFTNRSTLADDGLHPNPHGYDLVAQIWFNAIRQDLRSP